MAPAADFFRALLPKTSRCLASTRVLRIFRCVAGTYLLIEFKRPSHPITRDDIAQVEKYRDDLSSRGSQRRSEPMLARYMFPKKDIK